LSDEDGVEAFEIGKHDQLLQWRVIADVALGVRVSVAPLLRGLSEEGDVEQVGLVRVDEGGLLLAHGDRNERLLDGIGVDAVVDLGEGALEAPPELEAVVFVIFETLEFFDEVELEFRAEPGAELEGDVLVGVGAAVASGARDQSFGPGQVDPFFGGEEETVPSGLISNSLEFEGIKIRVMYLLPNP